MSGPEAGLGLLDELGDPDWWRNQAILSTRLRDLVAGFDSIGSFTIPYARLPRRLGAYAEDFPRWADVADQTPQALLSRPKLGAAAVRALIEAAQRAVQVQRDTRVAGRVGADAAVARLVGQLSDFDREILSAQVWALDPVPQHVVAERLGVHAVSVSRNLRRARARFAELLTDPAHQEVGEHANRLRRRLGPYLPVEAVHAELRSLGIEPIAQTAGVLLHVAGPYSRRGSWLEDTSTPAGGRGQVLAAVDAVFGAQAAPTADTLLHALTSLGLPTEVALTYLQGQKDLRRFGDVWVRWKGDTAANMTEAALQILGTPATAEAILATIRTGDTAGTSLERVSAVLSQDDRFVRTSRSTWGLQAWDVPEYVNIVHAIGERLDAAGDEASVTAVINELRARYPDVAETSIRAYIGTLAFVVEDGVVRRRAKADGWPAVPPLNTARGAFRNGANEIRVAVLVTAEVLRGSGQTVHTAVADAVGVSPGQQRIFASPHGPVTMSWKLASTTGVSIGSLRAHAAAVDASAGDTLVLVFRLAGASLDVLRVGAEDQGTARLQKLLGHAVRKPAAALATALNCRQEDVGAVLRRRGDDQLAAVFDDDAN
ncbi:winged helix-turn-helix domain-containing protein [Mycobacterium gallinarum]|nr:winged helix-turn-helix domain-containing protein [Mycobacterium gallinarum]